jgi:hypothetical protein
MAAEGNRGRLLTVLGLAGGVAILSAGAPAQAQFWGGWFGGWRSQPAPYAAPIPPRRVAAIIADEGYAMNGTPRRQGDIILADGVGRGGEHVRFVIDAYNGEILRTRIAAPAAGPPRPPGFVGNGEPPQAQAALTPNSPGPTSGLRPSAGQVMGGAQPGLEPLHPLAKPKAPKPKQTAAHTPAKPAAAPVPPKAPSEADKVTAPAPTATQESSPATSTEAKAPAGNPATPLAPDAAPVSPPAAPAPAMEAKAPTPQATPDIGPAVKKVDPAPTAVIPAPAAPSAPDFTDESK